MKNKTNNNTSKNSGGGTEPIVQPWIHNVVTADQEEASIHTRKQEAQLSLHNIT